jgi:hypothetical protein
MFKGTYRLVMSFESFDQGIMIVFLYSETMENFLSSILLLIHQEEIIELIEGMFLMWHWSIKHPEYTRLGEEFWARIISIL